MNNYIENLKTKPPHIRKRFALLVSSGFTLLIFAGWVMSYTVQPQAIVAQGKAKIEAPVSSLTASAIDVFKDIKRIFSSSNEVEYSSNALEVVGGDER